MAGIFTRKAILGIMNDADLTPEERTDQVFSLFGRAVDDGYITKQAASAEKLAAIEETKAKAQQPQAVKIEESQEYKSLLSEYNAYKVKQTARNSDDFKDVKSKFFDAVYDQLDHADNHKAYAEQLKPLRENFAEYFNETQSDADTGNKTPQFGGNTNGSMPTGNEKSFAAAWGYSNRKDD